MIAFVYGRIRCEPTHEPYHFKHDAWGVGAHAGESIGLLYIGWMPTSEFWTVTNGYHAQGLSDEGGILQINFFKGAEPIGQFNGPAARIGAFECGGRGQWHHT